ncbi:protein translocase subunit SecD, partial [Desulfovibrio sp. OttesenSCG-928-M16]|nr:protein translocase subunit SecD [Desulfovibrio sp. OttesenSCG-928-M16]
KQGLLWRVCLTLFILVTAVIFLLPTFLLPPPSADGDKAPKEGLARFLPSSRVNLGLDLMGGIHLTLEVETEKALEASLVQMGQDLMSEATPKGILMTRPLLVPGSSGRHNIEFTLASTDKSEELQKIIEQFGQQMEVLSKDAAAEGRLKYTLALTESAHSRLSDMTVDQALATIRNRIDQFGVAEPDVRKEQGGNRISIQLPGMSDPQRAVDIIGKTAHLEFRIVRDDVDPRSPMLPRGVQALPMEYKDKNGLVVEEPVAVDEAVVLTGDRISNAVPAFDNVGNSIVSLSFDRRGSDMFARITEENVNKRMAIVLDGKIHSAPRINEKISGGHASISGSFTPATANDLAVVLRAGALPAPVLVLEQRTVGPSLGQESIDMGVMAAVIGGAAVILFMAIYYGLSGIVANLMLLLDVGLILAGMAAFGATLTLPGIAGIVLTIGMAVDANVLIFERIREEMRRGLSPLAAVEAGFSRAMLAITDSNLTTIIAALILYQFGTGPVRGFAVTLTIGIVASMFTAIFVSRILFDMWMSKPGRKLSI